MRSVNAINQVTSVVEDPYQLPSVHTTTTAYSYDARGNRTSEVTTRATGNATHILGKVSNVFDSMDLLASTTDAGSNMNSAKDDSTTAWVRDGAGRALSVGVNGATRQRTYDGLALVSDGATALTRDPSGGVLTEATTKTVLTGKTATTTTSSVDVLTDVLGRQGDGCLPGRGRGAPVPGRAEQLSGAVPDGHRRSHRRRRR